MEPDDVRYRTKPWNHQLEAVLDIVNGTYDVFNFGMGSGKSKIVIDAIENLPGRKFLVVSTSNALKYTWPGQIERHGFQDTDYFVLSKGAESKSSLSVDKKKQMIMDAWYSKARKVVLIINYESVWREPVGEMLIRSRFDHLFLDESHLIKSPSSHVNLYMQRLRRFIPSRPTLMSGTLMADRPIDVYGQFKFYDPTIYGTNFNDFKDRYCVYDRWNPHKLVDYKNLEHFQMILGKYVKVLQTEDVCDLPLVQQLIHQYVPDINTTRMYKTLKRKGIAYVPNGDTAIVGRNPLARRTRIMQLAHGFATDDTGTIQVFGNSRVDETLDLISNMCGKPVVVFTTYKPDVRMLEEALNRGGITYSKLTGDTDTLQQWKSGNTQVLLANITAAGTSIDLTRADYVIYYGHSSKRLEMEQSLARIVRPSDERQPRDTPIVVYYLCADFGKDSIDEVMVQAYRNKTDIVRAIEEAIS